MKCELGFRSCGCSGGVISKKTGTEGDKAAAGVRESQKAGLRRMLPRRMGYLRRLGNAGGSMTTLKIFARLSDRLEDGKRQEDKETGRRTRRGGTE